MSKFSHRESFVFAGKDYMREIGITCPDSDFVGGCGRAYDPNVYPAASNDVSHGVLRSYHQNVRSDVNLYDENYNKISTVQLSDTILNNDLIENHRIELLRGLTFDPIRTSGCAYVTDLTDHLFPNQCGVSLDLFVTDLLRTRGSGNGAYADYADICLKRKINSWEGMADLFDKKVLKFLKRKFGDYRNVDLVVGSMLELITTPNGMSGTIRTCLMGLQFKILMNGDRFFFTRSRSPGDYISFSRFFIHSPKICISVSCFQPKSMQFKSLHRRR